MITRTLSDGATVDTVIVGGGQAGLSLSYDLLQRGVDHLVIERDSVAHEWRNGRWDNFTLVTPNWHCVLPGYPYAGDDPDGFMKRDEVYDWVCGFADSFDAPVVEGVAVQHVEQLPDGGFRVVTSAGTVIAKTVVAAVGGYHRPVVPAWAEDLPASITQVHSHLYRNAAQLPAGPVLVVGTGQSGTQIAEDLHLEGRAVHLAVGKAPRVARFYRGKDCMTWLADMGVYDVSIGSRGFGKRESTNHYVTGRDGGRDIDLRAFANEGMVLHGRATGIVDGTLEFDESLAASLDYADSVAESIKNDIDAYIERERIDAPDEDRYRPVWKPQPGPSEVALDEIASIVWAVGFRADWGWISSLDVIDEHNLPLHNRGITEVPGFFFLGLPWLNTWGSGRFHAIARDAEHLAAAVADQVATAMPVVAA